MIGSGPNGLVSACVLARAGLDVLVLETAAEAGGAVRTVESTLPGFRHDVGAAFFPFGQDSPALVDLGLDDKLLRFRHAAIDSAHPARDGSVGVVGRDLDRCAELMGRDGRTLRAWGSWWAGVQPTLLPALLAPFPPLREGLRVPPTAMLRLARVAVCSARGISEALFETEAARRLIPGLALHTDIGPDDPFGAMVGFMLAMTATVGGFAVPVGGAVAITRALLARLRSLGGRVQCDSRVTRIETTGGRAVAVQTARGDRVDASVAIVADTSAPALYLRLLPQSVVPSRLLEQMRRFRSGFGAFKIDWALSGAVPWTSEACREAAVVHPGESVDDLARFTSQVRAGRLPTDPYLVIGQQSLVDPSRAPAGKHTLWAYSRVPGQLEGGWTKDATRTFLARVEQRIEELAPGFRERILGRAVFAPPDLQAMNDNLLHGDLGGGTADISQPAAAAPDARVLALPHARARPVPGLLVHPPRGRRARRVWLQRRPRRPGRRAHRAAGA